ncbi:MAG: hypothetical protein JW900_03820 [Anaerolineae bacterium]|nr:hypothetical protein [Anaerolineae bacterium]
MHTLILRNKLHGQSARDVAAGASPASLKYSIEVLGESEVKDQVQQSIRELKVHPAGERRTLLDMLAIIDQHRLEICHAEHEQTEQGVETWTFVLQKR